MGRWFHSFNALAPNGDGFWQIGISQAKFRRLQLNGDIVWLSRLVLVEQVVGDPIRIIQGWERPDTEKCLVYVGKPQEDYRSPSITTPPPKGMLFSVFVLPDGTIDSWSWRPHSLNDEDMPEGIGGLILWPQQIP